MAYSRLLMISAALLLSVSACSIGHYKNSIPGSYGTYFKKGAVASKEGRYEEAVDNYAFAARSGHPRALVAFADALVSGRGVEPDPARAKVLLEDAYGKSSSARGRAALSLGSLLMQGGDGPSGTVEVDQERGIALMVSALEQGELRAAAGLGKVYDDGVGVSRNTTKAIEYFEQAAEKDVTSARRLASLLVETGASEGKIAAATDNAVSLLEERAEKGNSKAWIQLADVYLRGKIAEPDPEKALGYLENVEDKEDTAVLIRLAKVHNELGDSAKELEVLKKAADLGDVKAQTRLAQVYLKAGTENTNGEVGRYYAERAIAQGSESAMVYLGLALVKGEVVEKDLSIGETLLRRASDAEHTTGMMALGSTLLRSQILERYPGEGQNLLEAAAEKGSASAMSTLGFAYRSGKGVPKNEETALIWIKRAAKAGNSRATRFLEKQGIETDA